jgi:thiamine-phosphate diphosphorylase
MAISLDPSASFFMKDHNLYLVITEERCKGRGAMEVVRAAIAGGVDIIQMREKNKPREELVNLGRKLSRVCEDNKVLFIVNDDPSIAKEAGADGVHLGQEDAIKHSLNETRNMLGGGRIIGISTHSPEQFKAANDKDFDYIAFGPVFETKTKDYFLGDKDVEEVVRIAKKPVFFIGGINLANIGGILKKGAKNIAVIGGIAEAEDITLRTREFKKLLCSEAVA